MVLGSGLSMVDAWLTLAGRRHQGPIIVVSRHGLLPRKHKPVDPLSLDAADIPFGTSLTPFVGWFRELVAETVAKGGDWRSAVDGLRPFNQKDMAELVGADPCSASCAMSDRSGIFTATGCRPNSMSGWKRAVASSQITLIAGEFLGLEARKKVGVTATIRRRGLTTTEDLDVARVYDCGGVAVNISRVPIRCSRAWCPAGKARPDPMRIGLDVSRDCAVVDSDGHASKRLFAVGPLTRSQFFEIESVPEIRASGAYAGQSSSQPRWAKR